MPRPGSDLSRFHDQLVLVRLCKEAGQILLGDSDRHRDTPNDLTLIIPQNLRGFLQFEHEGLHDTFAFNRSTFKVIVEGLLVLNHLLQFRD